MTRGFVRVGALLLVVSLVGACSGGSGSGKEDAETTPTETSLELSGTVVINSSGGFVNEVLRKCFLDPFESETTVKVIDTSPVDFIKLQLMVDSGNVEWDITEISTGEEFYRAIDLGLLDGFGARSLPNTDEAVKGSVTDYGIQFGAYSTVLTFRTDTFQQQPSTWSDLFDTERFPGPRSLGNRPQDNLEIALLADGVSPDELYPLDVDRAFDKLDQIKNEVRVFWETGAESIQVMVDKEAVIGTAWNGRVFGAEGEGISIGLSWKQHLLHSAWLGIPKGAPNRDAAIALLGFIMNAERQGCWNSTIPYPGNNTKAFEYVPKDMWAMMPTSPANITEAVLTSDEWWKDNGEEVTRRWNEWVQG